MKRQIIKLALFISFTLLTYCSVVSDKNTIPIDTQVILDINKDTLNLRHLFKNGKTREIIFFKDNKPKYNIAYSDNGDTINWPKTIMETDNSRLHVYIPIDKYIDAYIAVHTADSGDIINDDSLFFGKVSNGDRIILDQFYQTKNIGVILSCKVIATGNVNVYPTIHYYKPHRTTE